MLNKAIIIKLLIHAPITEITINNPFTISWRVMMYWTVWMPSAGRTQNHCNSGLRVCLFKWELHKQAYSSPCQPALTLSDNFKWNSSISRYCWQAAFNLSHTLPVTKAACVYTAELDRNIEPDQALVWFDYTSHYSFPYLLYNATYKPLLVTGGVVHPSLNSKYLHT